MTPDTNLLNDEIDIRKLLQTLFRYKWIILGITVLAAVVVLVISKFGSPKSYAAQVQVIFTKPLSVTNLDASSQTTPQTPEASVVKDLALDDILIRNVFTSTLASGVLDQEIDFVQFKQNMSAKLTGTSKLYLVVSSKNPDTAASIANLWADEFISKINALYSVDKISVGKVAVQEAQIRWDRAEKDLIQNLPNAMADMYKIELTNKQSALTNLLNLSTRLNLIVKDADGFKTRLGIWPDNSKLNIENQISLIDLYQRAASGLTGSPVQGIQIQIAAPSEENLRTIGEAKASVDALMSSLNTEQEQLRARQDQLEKDITAATLAFESASYRLTQLTTERDLALTAYQSASAQLAESQNDLAREDVVAKLVGQALPPDEPISNRTLIKTLIAGALAFALSCFGVLFINWWKSPG